jgi:hypothetical protein
MLFEIDWEIAANIATVVVRALGFVETPAYYDSPIENTVFMSLSL